MEGRKFWGGKGEDLPNQKSPMGTKNEVSKAGISRFSGAGSPFLRKSGSTMNHRYAQ